MELESDRYLGVLNINVAEVEVVAEGVPRSINNGLELAEVGIIGVGLGKAHTLLDVAGTSGSHIEGDVASGSVSVEENGVDAKPEGRPYEVLLVLFD